MMVELQFLRSFGKYAKGDSLQFPLSGYTKELVRRKIAQVVVGITEEIPAKVPEKKADYKPYRGKRA